jgi:hypothetical protein
MIVLIVSAAFWLWGNSRLLLGLGRDDVALISANTLGSAVVVNRGDREVFVSHLLLFMPGRSANWQAPRLRFEERLPVGQFLRREFPRENPQEFREFVRGLNTPDFETLVNRAANGDTCLELIFFHGLRQLPSRTQNNGRADTQYLRGCGLSGVLEIEW